MRGKLVGGWTAGWVLFGVVLVFLLGAGTASAAAPWWQMETMSVPSNLSPGGEGKVVVRANNLGDAPTAGTITMSDVLPEGFTATSVSITGAGVGGLEEGACTTATLTCTMSEPIDPYVAVELHIQVKVGASAHTGEENRVSVTGGGAPGIVYKGPLTVNASPVAAGVEVFELSPFNEDGTPATRAGSHPFELTTTVELNKVVGDGSHGPGSVENALPAGMAKDLHFHLPPGLIGNPTPLAKCSQAQFETETSTFSDGCPADTAVGVAKVLLYAGSSQLEWTVPLFSLEPYRGEPARFGFFVIGVPVVLDTAVATGGDYAVLVNVNNISQADFFLGSQVTFWGVPGDPRHDSQRGWECVDGGLFGSILGQACTAPASRSEVPFLTLPTSCAGPLSATVSSDSWEEAGHFTSVPYAWHTEAGEALGLSGCDRLNFNPSISVAPDSQAGSSPSGLTVGVHVPQAESLTPNGLSQANVRTTTVTLPKGIQLNPSAADGLLSCSIGQVSLESDDSGTCPEGAKVGTVEIKSPLLPEALTGAVYLAQQDANPFGSLVALYIVAEDPAAGVIIKLAGRVTPDAVSGQLVSTFENTPQLPFEDLKLHFFGGARAPLATPAYCGSYSTSASIEPWSGTSAVTPQSTFQITSGPNGSACSDPLPFTPSLNVGSTNVQAGGFSTFTLTMSREDGDQTLNGIELHMPLGLLGDLATVKLCGEPEAEQGTCGPESLIGHTVVSVGDGPSPLSVSTGRVYITGGYKGAPYGLSIVEPAVAGPFNLGTVVVRAAINVNPRTAALTVTSYPLPTILDGIPLEIQHVNVAIDRPGFIFNPTNCNPTQISGKLSSTEGAASNVLVPFQVTNCRVLGFNPKFSVSTSGKTSRAAGASLDAKLTYPPGQGTQTNITKVKVDLPKQLPSRLTTLQKACVAAVFEANPSNCPVASRIGVARATTPVLTDALTGPVFFVSYGGAKFPEIVVVLEADGVRVDLHGETFINKEGITSSTFTSIPDVPIGTFQLYLPQGPDSALAANGNLCKGKLEMPTAFQAQDGAVIHQSTPITVTGCPKAKLSKASKARKAGAARADHMQKNTTRQAQGASHGDAANGRSK